jgi:hypothetical protein
MTNDGGLYSSLANNLFASSLRQSASDHLLGYLLGGLAIKLVAFGKSALIQSVEGRTHASMNERSSGFDDDEGLIVVAVAEPVEGHLT